MARSGCPELRDPLFPDFRVTLHLAKKDELGQRHDLHSMGALREFETANGAEDGIDANLEESSNVRCPHAPFPELLQQCVVVDGVGSPLLSWGQTEGYRAPPKV